MAKRLRDYFFTSTSTAVKRGTRLLNGDRPAKATFQDLLDSVLFRKDSNDRAKEDDGASLESITGHVVAATDAQVLSYVAKVSDRTRVVQPSQLTEVEGEEQELSDWGLSGEQLIEVIKDSGTTSRNKFIIRFKDAFLAALDGIFPRLMPPGGTAGQVVTKIDGDDYNTEWTSAAGLKVTGADTTSGNLDDKIVVKAGGSLVKTILNPGGNEQLEISYSAPDAAKVFYVNGYNTEPGDGSILSPFQSIDRVYDRILNLGDFSNTGIYPAITNPVIQVSGYSGVNYETTKNLWKKGAVWNFDKGTVVVNKASERISTFSLNTSEIVTPLTKTYEQNRSIVVTILSSNFSNISGKTYTIKDQADNILFSGTLPTPNKTASEESIFILNPTIAPVSSLKFTASAVVGNVDVEVYQALFDDRGASEGITINGEGIFTLENSGWILSRTHKVIVNGFNSATSDSFGNIIDLEFVGSPIGSHIFQGVGSSTVRNDGKGRAFRARNTNFICRDITYLQTSFRSVTNSNVREVVLISQSAINSEFNKCQFRHGQTDSHDYMLTFTQGGHSLQIEYCRFQNVSASPTVAGILLDGFTSTSAPRNGFNYIKDTIFALQGGGGDGTDRPALYILSNSVTISLLRLSGRGRLLKAGSFSLTNNNTNSGWGTPTANGAGVSSRAAFNMDTVTLPELAKRVAAIIEQQQNLVPLTDAVDYNTVDYVFSSSFGD